MNGLPPETIVELNRRRIQEEMAAIRLEEEAVKGQNFLSKNLAALGAWMVARGQSLQRRHSPTRPISSEFTKRIA
jgi:hypothetical protein